MLKYIQFNLAYVKKQLKLTKITKANMLIDKVWPKTREIIEIKIIKRYIKTRQRQFRTYTFSSSKKLDKSAIKKIKN